MSFFWPTKVHEAPGALARFGRVLHWAALAIAGAFVLGLLAMILEDGLNEIYAPASLLLGLAAFFALAGRGLRYIFAAE